MSANEATLVLDDAAIDCVVTDYQMPEVDGIQLLERIRADHPRLPFILVTGEGSEETASRAIDADVTDYLVKDPRADQTPLLASKIRNAVEQHRLQRAIEESEERYRTVTEQSRDAIVILQDDRPVFFNERLLELADADRDDLTDAAFVDDLVHPDDRDRVAGILDAPDDAESQLHDARLLRADGTVRHTEFTARAITFDADHATLASIRDVTRRTRWSRRLEAERDLHHAVQESLVESRSRDALEAAVASHLADHGYDLVWIADDDGTRLRPRVTEGDATYLDHLDLTVDEGDHDSEPAVWAARSGDPQFVQDFEALFSTAWRDHALDAGYRAGAALPLVYNDVNYGVLAVYDADLDRFDDTERRLLVGLAETVALAIHNLDRETALAADQRVAATLRLDDPTHYLADLAGDTGATADGSTITVEGTLPHDADRFLQYATIPSIPVDEFCDAATDHPNVHDATVVSADDARIQFVVDREPPEARLAAVGAMVRTTELTTSHATVELELPHRQTLRPAVEALDPTAGAVTVRSCVAVERGDADGDWDATVDQTALTEKQSTALRAAYHHGYFEQPRGNSASEIADSLGVSHSTFLQHLRVAQQKTFEQLYE